MQDRLSKGRKVGDQQVRIGVACEEHELKEEHAGGPDGRTAAEPRQDRFADDRLNLKQQKRGDQNGGCRPKGNAERGRSIHRWFRSRLRKNSERERSC